MNAVCSDGRSVSDYRILASLTVLDKNYVDHFFTRAPIRGLTFESGSQLIRIDAGAFFDCTSLISIQIPASMQIIGEKCFSRCGSLLKILFEAHSRLTRIEKGAFSDCVSIKSLFIPASVAVLCHECFAGCTSLQAVIFARGSNLRQLESQVFWHTSLKSICIPSDISSPRHFLEMSALLLAPFSV
jgi:hypothetical protein